MRSSLGFLAALSAAAASQMPWQNPALPLRERVADLVGRLSLKEKLANMEGHAPGARGVGLGPYAYTQECERGYNSGPVATAFPQSSGLAQTFDPALVYAIGRAASDEAHAYYNDRRRANSSAERSLSCFGPVVNFPKTPLWGRSQEGLRGEAPDALTRHLVQAYTTGLQFLGNPPTDWRTGRPAEGALDRAHRSRAPPDPKVCGPNATVGRRPEILTILKHFVAYDGPEGFGFTFGPHEERFHFDATGLSERALRQTYLPAFRWGIEAGAVGVMSSYNAIDGVPATANKHTLTDVLRGEWGLDDEPTRGYVITDAGASQFVDTGHHYTNTLAEAAVAAVGAGVDIELTCCGLDTIFQSLADCVRNGTIREQAIDAALSRALWSQLRTGAQDPVECDPFAWLNVSAVVGSPAHIALAERAALSALTLLKNGPYIAGRPDPAGDDVGAPLPFPLDLASAADADLTVCVTGPAANQTQDVLGDYHPQGAGPGIVTHWEGIRDAVGAAGVRARFVPVPGCDDVYCHHVDVDALTRELSHDCGAAIVAVVGTSAWSHIENVTNACGCPKGTAIEGECCDRYGVGLAGRQADVVRAAVRGAAAGGLPNTHVGVVLNAAMMVDVSSFLSGEDEVGFIMHAPFLGQAAGTAVGLALSDVATPGGRLATTWYDAGPDLDGIPGIRNYSTALSNTTYQHHDASPMFPFGSAAVYFPSSVHLAVPAPPSSAAACSSFTLGATAIIHASDPNASTVVQAYVSGSGAAPENPKATLVAFRKIAASASGRPVELTVDTADLAEPVQDATSGRWGPAIVPGRRTLTIADDAGFLAGGGRPTESRTIEITSPDGKPVPLSRCGSRRLVA